jgi:hypothetical protein
MAAKKAKEQLRQEPLLSAVARKLGQAAGTVTNLTHGLLAHGSAEDSSALSATIATTVRRAKNQRTNRKTNQGTTAQPAVTRSVPHRKKKSRRAAATGKSKRAVAKRTRSHGQTAEGSTGSARQLTPKVRETRARPSGLDQIDR